MNDLSKCWLCNLPKQACNFCRQISLPTCRTQWRFDLHIVIAQQWTCLSRLKRKDSTCFSKLRILLTLLRCLLEILSVCLALFEGNNVQLHVSLQYLLYSDTVEIKVGRVSWLHKRTNLPDGGVVWAWTIQKLVKLSHWGAANRCCGLQSVSLTHVPLIWHAGYHFQSLIEVISKCRAVEIERRLEKLGVACQDTQCITTVYTNRATLCV
jgi:hypothetical protein